jgi:hypothetical protein
MIQEADNMDKGLKAVLLSRMPLAGPPSAPQLPSMGIPPPSAQPANPDPPQGSEPASSPEGATSHRAGLFDEEVRIAMGKLKI